MWCSISVYVADVVHFCVEINSEFGGADGSNFFAHYLLDWKPLLREYLLFISFGENAQKNFYVTFFLDIITQNDFL